MFNGINGRGGHDSEEVNGTMYYVYRYTILYSYMFEKSLKYRTQTYPTGMWNYTQDYDNMYYDWDDD